jgi:hypothetical protein
LEEDQERKELERDAIFFFFEVLGLELRAYTLSHSTSPFYVRHFQDRFL